MNAKKLLALFLSAMLCLSALPLSAASAADPAGDRLQMEIDRYNYIIGANDIGPGYHFTDADPVLEAADRILAWGSNMVKFTADSNPERVFEVLGGRDFDYVFVWFRSGAPFLDGYDEAEAQADYDAFYSLTARLLRTYDGTGKTFYLGHWEGDWYYLDGYDTSKQRVDDVATDGMIAWINTRQRAVDDAKRDVPHADVEVWNYLEVNRPTDAMNKGYDRVVNRVLPYTNVDYVSYSAYDSKGGSTRAIKKVIDYIYENLPEKSGVPGPRVFVGEIAEPASSYDYNDLRHCEGNLRLMVKYLSCDVRFCLYWEMYCNGTTDDGRSKGFWLVDSDGNETLLYKKLQRVFADGRDYVERFAERNGRVPTEREYRAFLLSHPAFAAARVGVFFEDLVYPFKQLVKKLGDLFKTA